MKRIICFFMALTVFCLSLAGCSQSDEQMPDGKSASTDTILSADVNSEITQDGLEIISGVTDRAPSVDADNKESSVSTESAAGTVTNTSDTSATAKKEEATSSTGTKPVNQETNQGTLVHTHSLQYHKQVAATCTGNGIKEYWHCTGCGKNFSDNRGLSELSSITISAKGHTAGNWITDKEPTETSTGSRHIICTICGVTLQTEMLAKLPLSKLHTTTYSINGVDFKMILVEAGTFTMGSDNTNVAFSESPAHKVTLTQDYLMGETEVTEAIWNAVMSNGGGSNTHPKTSVTWNEAHTFVDRLTEIAREQGLISDDMRFRLPTEAQWEFAAKGGNQSKGYLYAGSNDINEVAVTLENSGSSPIDVKTKLPNELGLYDMSGNAYEWVDDYGGSYSADDQVDPQNTTVSRQYVKRGGSNYHNFSSESYLFTTTGRYFYSSTDCTIGLRICLY